MARRLAAKLAIEVFARTLAKIRPGAEDVGIDCSEISSDDDWEDIERTIYKSFVSNAVFFSIPHQCLPLPTYDVLQTEYKHNSLVVERPKVGSIVQHVFHKLSSVRMAYDAADFIVVDRDFARIGRISKRPLNECDLVFALRREDGTIIVSDSVDY